MINHTGCTNPVSKTNRVWVTKWMYNINEGSCGESSPLFVRKKPANYFLTGYLLKSVLYGRYTGLEVNFFIHLPAGDKMEKFGRQIKNFGHQFQKTLVTSAKFLVAISSPGTVCVKPQRWFPTPPSSSLIKIQGLILVLTHSPMQESKPSSKWKCNWLFLTMVTTTYMYVSWSIQVTHSK